MDSLFFVFAAPQTLLHRKPCTTAPVPLIPARGAWVDSSRRILCRKCRLLLLTGSAAQRRGRSGRGGYQDDPFDMEDDLDEAEDPPTNFTPAQNEAVSVEVMQFDAHAESDDVDEESWKNTAKAGQETEESTQDDARLLVSVSLLEYEEKRAQGALQREDLPSGWIDRFACSVHDKRFTELANLYSRVGIMMENNFDDFMPCSEDTSYLSEVSLHDLSLFKAREVYRVTGMPAIAESTRFEIDGPKGKPIFQCPPWLVSEEGATEKRINEVQDASGVDTSTQCFYESTAAYCDGENEIITKGRVDMLMAFASPARATIARSSALDNLYRELTGLLHLDIAHFEKAFEPEGSSGDPNSSPNKLVGGMMLRDRILREGKVLRDGILKVSSFLNHKVDAELMDLCGIELAERLRGTMANKVLTVEATGLIPALSVGRRLDVPVVFARKSRPLTISDSFQTMYRSQTKGTMSELIVSTEYLSATDRVLIIDDFLAGGSTAEALCKLANMARAKVVGVGVLIEKTEGGGRVSLSGYDVPVVSLARILSLAEGRIEMGEPEPFTDAGL
eukprot:Plantae.Rhodophyta-Rhodochaete_pulchella.ctg5811.p1 GENE.Plantae.Rhodophyta-Rhodochaete_pulchella.ctg5811~~Plantae.Rhodophyta-Rhodochaete_pulchella.ctg5811.p1  ORF type:complete len:562 (+),score=95.35 Plantae.Rhodophyta-Rhodochaete_pulchella.ctg5811:1126-2811(+)